MHKGELIPKSAYLAGAVMPPETLKQANLRVHLVRTLVAEESITWEQLRKPVHCLIAHGPKTKAIVIAAAENKTFTSKACLNTSHILMQKRKHFDLWQMRLKADSLKLPLI